MSQKLAAQIAASSFSLIVRRALVLVTSAVSTAVIARALTTDDYGRLQAALAVWTILLSICDFGFGPVLSREFAAQPDSRPALLHAGRNLQAFLGAAGAASLLVTGLLAGSHTAAGGIYLAFAPGLIFTAFNGGRSLFLATFDTRALIKIDVVVAVIQCAATVAVAATTNSPVLIALVVGLSTALNSAWVGIAARRRTGRSRPGGAVYRTLLRQVVPVGASSIVSRLYLSIDLVILGTMAADTQTALYAGAVKIVTFLNALTGLVISAALPGLAAVRDDPQALLTLANRVVLWLCLTVLPCFCLAAVFATPLCGLLLGDSFTGSAPLVAILAGAGLVAAASQVLGAVLTSFDVVRPMLMQNLAAVAVNIAANLLLVPVFAATASAYITVVTELIVCLGSAWTLTRRHEVPPALSALVRPLTAVGVMTAVGLALRNHPWFGVPAAVAAFAVTVLLLRCWPEELSWHRTAAGASAPTPRTPSSDSPSRVA